MISLQIEFVERRQQLGHRANALISHVDAIIDGQRDQPGVQTGPQTLLSDLIAAHDFQLIETLQELQQGLQTSVRYVATSQNQTVNVLTAVRKVLNEIENVGIVGVQQAKGVEASALQRLKVVHLHLVAAATARCRGGRGSALVSRNITGRRY